MAIKNEPYYIQGDLSTLANNELRQAADEDDCYEIDDIVVDGAGALARLQINIGRIMAEVPCDDAAAEILKYVAGTAYSLSFFKQLREHAASIGLDIPYWKIASGQELIIKNPVTDDGYVKVKLRRADAGDYKKADPGGSESTDRLIFLNGRTTEEVALSSTEDFKISDNVNSPGLTRFPFEINCPAGVEYDVIGFCTRLNDASGANITYDGFQIWANDESVLMSDQEFLLPAYYPYQEGVANKDLHFLNKPWKWTKGAEVNTVARCSNASVAAAEDAVVDFTYICIQRKIST